MPDGKWNSKQDKFSNKDFTILGGGLGEYGYCVKKVQIHFGGDYAKKKRRRMAKAASNYLHHDNYKYSDYVFEGSEHTYNGHRFAAEVQFWTYKCKKASWEESLKKDGYTAVFSVMFKAFDPNGKANLGGCDRNLDLENIAKASSKRRRMAGDRFKDTEASDGCMYNGDTNKNQEGMDNHRYSNSLYKLTSYYLANSSTKTLNSHALGCAGTCRTMSFEDHHKDMYIDLQEIVPPRDNWGDYFYYEGGMTQPPCYTKKTKWHIMKKVMPINKYLLYKWFKYTNGLTSGKQVKASYRNVQNDIEGGYYRGAKQYEKDAQDNKVKKEVKKKDSQGNYIKIKKKKKDAQGNPVKDNGNYVYEKYANGDYKYKEDNCGNYLYECEKDGDKCKYEKDGDKYVYKYKYNSSTCDYVYDALVDGDGKKVYPVVYERIGAASTIFSSLTLIMSIALLLLA